MISVTLDAAGAAARLLHFDQVMLVNAGATQHRHPLGRLQPLHHRQLTSLQACLHETKGERLLPSLHKRHNHLQALCLASVHFIDSAAEGLSTMMASGLAQAFETVPELRDCGQQLTVRLTVG